MKVDKKENIYAVVALLVVTGLFAYYAIKYDQTKKELADCKSKTE